MSNAASSQGTPRLAAIVRRLEEVRQDVLTAFREIMALLTH